MGNCKSKRQDSVVPDQQLNNGHLMNGHSQFPATNFSQDSNLEPSISAQRIISQFGYNQTSANTTAMSEQEHCNKAANDAVIDSTRVEVNGLLEKINEFHGTSADDKNYRFLDEMLTRCILRLDQLECNSSEDRNSRKGAIKGVNEAIMILERKLSINKDIKDVETNLKQ